MINLKTSKKTPTITVGVNPVITNVVNAPSTQPPPDIAEPDETTRPPSGVGEVAELKRQIEVLKPIIEIQQSNHVDLPS